MTQYSAEETIRDFLHFQMHVNKNGYVNLCYLFIFVFNLV